MYVIIAGGGRTGSHLSSLLITQGHKVRLIESRPETLAGLHRELPTEVIFEGDYTDPQVLEAAGIGETQVLAAVSASDADNIVVCSLAREVYNVRRIIGRVNNPKNAWLFTPDMGVDVALNQADLMAKLIEEEMSLGDMMILSKLRRGNYSVVEEKIFPGAMAVGRTIRELKLPEHCYIAGILRGSELLLPHGDTQLKTGDEVVALTDDDGAELLAKVLGRPTDFK
jgi:trk system potassium uptake protein TrkA